MNGASVSTAAAHNIPLDRDPLYLRESLQLRYHFWVADDRGVHYLDSRSLAQLNSA